MRLTESNEGSVASASRRSATLRSRLAAIPSVDRVLRHPEVEEAIGQHGRAFVVQELRDLLEQHRARLKKGGREVAPSETSLVVELSARLRVSSLPSLRRIFNLTGTVLHTNLGRALLPQEAAQAAARSLVEACNLEYDLDEGHRGERDSHVEALICRLAGAEAATVVNNNAGAVFLALNSLAHGMDVVVSRGELVEIGGSFRVPEIMQGAGCRLREIGTTNRTHLRDYERVIGKETAAVLRVHASNYSIVGFVASPTDTDLVKLAHRHGLPFISDLGSGSLVDLTKWGLPAEPTPMRALAAGADLVTFSGDKLLGGPQAGIVVGRRKYVDMLRRNPLKRALRIDKARVAALEVVLRLYLDPDRLPERLPTLRLLTRRVEDIVSIANRVRDAVQAFCGTKVTVDVKPCASQVGSGSLPVDRLPSAAIRLVWNVSSGSRGKGTARIVSALRSLPIRSLAGCMRTRCGLTCDV